MRLTELVRKAIYNSWEDSAVTKEDISNFVSDEMSRDIAPCFTERVATINTLDIRDIRKYLEYAKKNAHRGVLMFSVTEREPNYKEWVKQGLSFAGATCTVGRSKNHGDYKCFFVCIPAEHRYRSYQEIFKD